jgi:hypothetical protein
MPDFKIEVIADGEVVRDGVVIDPAGREDEEK